MRNILFRLYSVRFIAVSVRIDNRYILNDCAMLNHIKQTSVARFHTLYRVPFAVEQARKISAIFIFIRIAGRIAEHEIDFRHIDIRIEFIPTFQSGCFGRRLIQISRKSLQLRRIGNNIFPYRDRNFVNTIHSAVFGEHSKYCFTVRRGFERFRRKGKHAVFIRTFDFVSVCIFQGNKLALYLSFFRSDRQFFIAIRLAQFIVLFQRYRRCGFFYGNFDRSFYRFRPIANRFAFTRKDKRIDERICAAFGRSKRTVCRNIDLFSVQQSTRNFKRKIGNNVAARPSKAAILRYTYLLRIGMIFFVEKKRNLAKFRNRRHYNVFRFNAVCGTEIKLLVLFDSSDYKLNGIDTERNAVHHGRRRHLVYIHVNGCPA